jgi:ABC-2 type transport system permease protein
MKNVWLIFKREYVQRIKGTGFIVGTVLGVLGIVGLSFLPLLFVWLDTAFTSPLVIVAPDQHTAAAVEDALKNSNYKITIAKEPATGPGLPTPVKAALTADKYDAGLVAYKDASGATAFAFYPKKSSSLEKSGPLRQSLVRAVLAIEGTGPSARLAQRALNFPFKVVNLNQRYKNEGEQLLSQALVYFLLLLLYMSVLLYGMFVAQGVIEEKSNRIMEVMIGAVRPTELLTGKILGIGSLALTQFAIFLIAAGSMLVLVGLNVVHGMQPGAGAVPGAVATPAAMAAASGAAAAMPAAQGIAVVPVSVLVYLVVFFLLGFFSYAAMFAGMGALCSKAEDIQQANAFMVMPVILAYLLSIFALSDPDKPLFVWASMVPLISPMLMFTRVATASVPAWQIGVAVGTSLLAIWGLTLLAGKLYRVGVLMYGKPPTPVEIWRALRAST